MPTENTSLKITAPAGDSTTTNDMVNGKITTYQHTFLIVAGSLLALLVLIVVAGTSGGQHLQSSANDIAKDAVALADYQVDSANLALTKDIFGIDEGKPCGGYGGSQCIFACGPCYRSTGGNCISSCYSCCLLTEGCSCPDCNC